MYGSTGLDAERVCILLRLGRVDYGQAFELQQRLAEQRKQQLIGDLLILLEHPHVYTLGRSAEEGDILASNDTPGTAKAQIYRTDRGGQITYHGPGQVVGYPIVGLSSNQGPRWYVCGLEEMIIRTLAEFGIRAGRETGLPGVWAEDGKIAAIGVRISRGVTTHGFALNVNPDLSYFDGIVPCGIIGRSVTSMSLLIGEKIEQSVVELALARNFAAVFGYAMESRLAFSDMVTPECLSNETN